ncbi:hypothetical protein ACP70R_004523 [Stipagrostis hirtigluma subsp. patula]
MASPPAGPKPCLPEAPAPALKLTDDLLAHILLRLPVSTNRAQHINDAGPLALTLPTAADLGRASAACPTFRRVIADHAFLRRFRALHPPPLLGVVTDKFIRAQPPHPSAAAARAFEDAADFSCSFLPSHDSDPPGYYDRFVLVKEFAVCDPLHRRYLLLPTIPDDLTTLVDWRVRFQAFLAPSSEEEHEVSTSFRVICLAEGETKLVFFTFSPDGGQWHGVEFDGWSALTAEPGNSFWSPELDGRYYVHKCFCWVMPYRNKLLMLNACTMVFSTIDIPPAHPVGKRAIVEATEGMFGIFTPCFDREHRAYNLSYTVLRHDDQGANQWQPETIQLPRNYLYNIVGVAGGYLMLVGTPLDPLGNPIIGPNRNCYSLNLKTFQIEWFCGSRCLLEDVPLYAGFAPSLSPPTI